MVLKPATVTRLSALLFAEICAEAGLPPGVFNVITGQFLQLIPCPSISPNYFGRSELLWSCTNRFGRVQNILVGSKSFWSGSN